MNNVDESLFTNAFDSQIKLVERALLYGGVTEEGTLNSANKSFDTKTSKENVSASAASNSKQQSQKQLKQQQQLQEEAKKNLFTHKSRKFRFDSKSDVLVPPVPSELSNFPQSETKDEAQSSMMMAWYMAGYHTGYYDAIKKFEKK